MAQQGRDEAGNIWNLDVQGRPTTLAQPARARPSMTVAPPAYRVQQQARDDGRKDEDQSFQRHRLANEDARLRADQANIPLQQRILAAQATKAEADAKGATQASAPIDPTLDKLTGDDYVKRLPAETQAQVRALSAGRMAFPSGSALKSPYWQTMLQHVAHYDPNFDAINYNARASTRRDYVSGKSAQNIRALNTAIGHLGQLESQIGGTASHGGLPGATLLNQMENAVSRSAGSAGITKYEQTAGAVASELTQVFRGSGGAEADIQREIEHLSPNASYEQKKASVQNIATLLKSRLDALGDQYTQGMGTTADPLHLLNPHAASAYASLSKIDPTLGSGQPESGGGDGGGGGPIATGPSRTERDPTASALIDTLLRSGAGLDQINASLAPLGFRPVAAEQYDAAKKYLAANPGYKGGFGEATRETPMSLRQRASGSAGGAFVSHAVNDALAGLPAAATRTQGVLAAQEAGHPSASLAGSITGGVVGSGALELGLARGAAKLGGGVIARLLANPMTADAAYGGVQGAASGDGVVDGVIGAGAGVLGGVLGRKAGASIGGLLKGVTSAPVQYLRKEGVDLTAGQALSQSGRVGAAVKGVEDRLAGLPVVGDVVNARRLEGLQGFNRAAFDQGMAPINASTNGAIGEEGIDTARKAISGTGGAYDQALNGVTLTPDQPFQSSVAAALVRGSSLPRVGPEFGAFVDRSIAPHFGASNGQIDGRQVQDILQQVRGADFGTDSMGNLATDAGRDIEGAVMDLAGRQAPGSMESLGNANTSYRNLNILADSVGRGINNDGLFMPSQLGAAARSNTTKFGGKIAAATPDRPFYELQRAGQQVLPSKVPDSGTAGRMALLALPAVLGGVGAGAGYASGDTETGAASGLSIAALLAAGGTKAGQRALVSALMDRPTAVRNAGQIVIDNGSIARLLGVGGLTALTSQN